MANRTLDVSNMITPDSVASTVANRFEEWSNTFMRGWVEEKKELRNYVFATDTRTTENAKLPWSNSTTTPKLTQIYDNLKANYSAALFPNEEWFRWEGDDLEATKLQKVATIKAYVKTKVKQTPFVNTVSDELLDDWILTGNCFATVDYEHNIIQEPTGVVSSGYVGPVLKRISPFDIAFDITASSFKKSPKIVRSIKTLGEIKNLVEEGDEQFKDVYTKMMSNRSKVGASAQTTKTDGFIADGFTSLENYYQSGFVEVLTFYGDLYDEYSNSVKSNRIVTVVDRSYVISDVPNPSWLGEAPIFHSVWRSRPDNLLGMGPLDNLVGMQYRIDHLENLRADVFDQIALPMLKIRGDVEDFDHEPGGRIYMGEEGDVVPLPPDATALQADFQIQTIENKMEELAGAPRSAMGIRTPGEKTAFEVDSLQNAANRIFTHKIAKFERELIEPVLNAMLESGRRNMRESDTMRVWNDQVGVEMFKEVKRDDILANGRIYPIGARHYQERSLRVQNLNNIMQIRAMDPTVGVHLSSEKIAQMLSHEIGEPELFTKNVLVAEQAETQKASLDAEADIQEDLEIKAEEGL